MFKRQNSLFTINKISRSSWRKFVVHFDGNTHLHGKFSANDIFQIRKLIATKTKEEILSIQYYEIDKKIEVQTGFQRGPLDGGGQVFTVKKENNQWVITDQGSWGS